MTTMIATNRVLTTKTRDKLEDSSFAIPETRSYPIHDLAHARNALARVVQNGTPAEQARVRKAVHRKYPELGKDEQTNNNTTWQEITTNLLSKAGRIRTDYLEGREYFVAPMVMLTEGVHNGSNGPLYYPPDELAKTPVVWNYKPIVVYHPQMNGQSISACDKTIIESRKVGVIMNTRYVGGKLKAEAWLEKARLGEVDKRVLNAIQSNTVMEVSTGLFTDNQGPGGTWNNEKYVATARNYRPDHLAILPDQKGSCSIADGAGLLMNKTADGKIVGNTSTGKESDMDKEKIVDEIIANEASGWTEDERDFLMALDDNLLGKVSMNAAAAADDTEDEELANDTTDKKGNKKLTKGKVADAVDKTDPVNGKGKAPKQSQANGEDAEDQAPCDNDEEDMDPETWIANHAPEGIRDMLSTGLASFNAEKARVVGTITANKANTFTEDYLMTKSLEELRAISKLAANAAPKRTPRFAGDVTTNMTSNAAIPVLEMPAMEFSSK